MKRILIALFLFATASFAATWKSEGPYFGTVHSIAVDPANPDRLWAATHGGGVWRSTDGGSSWRLAGKELADRVVSYVVMQPKSTTLWAGVEPGALARSKDGGETWQWISDDLTSTPYAPAFDPSNPKAIWIPSSNLHQRSADAGASWTQFRVTGGDVRVFVVHPKDSKTIWAGGANGRAGLWRSIDGGASWKQLGRGLPESNQVRALLVDPSRPDTLYMSARRGGYKSTDGGESWTPFGGFPSGADIESLTIHAATPDVLFAGTDKGLYRTSDGGQSWTRVGGGLPRYIVSSMTVHPSSPNVMWAATSGAGIYKSADGGKSWTEANQGLAASWIQKVWGDASGTIFAQAGRGLFRTDGRGAWTELLQPFSDDEARVSTIVFDANSPRTVHAGWSWSYYRSTDGGTSWSEVVKPFQEPRPIFDSLALDPKSPKTLYSADDDNDEGEPAIFKSTDGGVKWKPAYRGVTGKGILALVANPGGALIAIGKDGTVWRSADGATTWSRSGGLQGEDLQNAAIDPSNPSRIYVAAKSAFYRSEDGGATFTSAKLEPAGVAVDAQGNVYIATSEGVSRSSDGGRSWKAFNDGLTNRDVRAIHAAGTRLYVGTAGGGVFSIDLEK